MMHMMRGILTPLALRNIAKMGTGSTYTQHQLIWEIMRDSPDRKRDFLYRWEASGSGLPKFYIVGEREFESDIDGTVSIESKPYRPELKPGMRFHFALRANTVVKKRDDDGKQTRHDVVMDRKLAIRDGEEEPIDDLVRTCGLEWLAKRAAQHGFEFRPEDVLVFGHRQLDFKKRRNGRNIRLSLMDFEGVLTVGEPDEFRSALFDGVGPAKAYGCGLMLIRPA